MRSNRAHEASTLGESRRRETSARSIADALKLRISRARRAGLDLSFTRRVRRFGRTMATRSEKFRTLVEKDPANALFRFSLGQALLEEGRAADAIPHLEFCARSNAEWMMARILLGKALLSEGHEAEAQTVVEDALRLAIEQHHETPESELRELLKSIESPP